MKIRNGFVSNSSSSSFCLGKSYMTDEQIEKFSSALNKINENNYGEGYINETKYYFHGEVSNHNPILPKIIDELNLNEYMSWR